MNNAKVYEDSRGWRYRVMRGLGTEYKARYKKLDMRQPRKQRKT